MSFPLIGSYSATGTGADILSLPQQPNSTMNSQSTEYEHALKQPVQVTPPGDSGLSEFIEAKDPTTMAV